MKIRLSELLVVVHAMLCASEAFAQGAPSTLSVPASSDAWVWSSNPTTNYGINLNVKNPDRQTFLNFQVAGVNGRSVESVTLRLVESVNGGAGDASFEVRQIIGAWSDTGVTWNSRPATGTLAGAYNGGQLAESQVLDIPLDPRLFSRDGVYGLSLVPTGGTNDSNFSSSEQGSGPQLIIAYRDSAPARLSYVANADAWVWSAQPGTNYSINLNVQAPDRITLLRFSVAGISRAVTTAKIVLRESPYGAAGNTVFEIRRVVGGWDETSVTWASRPAVSDDALGALVPAGLQENQQVEVFIDPSVFSGDGTYDFALIGRSGTVDSDFSSRESGDGPRLELSFVVPAASSPIVVGDPVDGYNPGYVGCGPALAVPAPTLGSDGQYAYDSISYASMSGGTCHAAPSFCDAQGNPAPRPSEEELNAPPPAGSMCPPLASTPTSDCGLNPQTLTGPCAIDADCGSGQVCRATCGDSACTSVAMRCGRLYDGCAGAPAESDCEDGKYFECPDPRDRGEVNIAEVEAALPQVAAFAPNDPDVHTPLALQARVWPYVSPLEDACEHALVEKQKKDQGPKKSKMLSFGNDKWGLFFGFDGSNLTDVRYMHDAKDVLSDLSKAVDVDFDEIGGTLSANMWARVFGFKVDVLSAEGSVSVGQCETDLGVTLKVFRDAIVVWDKDEGWAYGLDAGKTPPTSAADCHQKFNKRNADAGQLRKSVFTMRQVRAFALQHGVTRDLCERTNSDLGTSFPCDPVSGAGDTLPLVVDAWEDDYKKNIARFKASKNDFDRKQRLASFDHSFKLKPIHKPYTTRVAVVNIPIGPFQVVVVVDGYGFWAIKGSLGVGIGFDGQEFGENKLSSLPVTGTAGDTRIIAGPTITPELGFGVQGFAGVGIPGVALGIEGRLEIIRMGLPIEARAGFGRYAQVDQRDIQAIYPGPTHPDMDLFKVYKVGRAFALGISAELHAMDGEVNFAARVRLGFFKKTFRHKLASFKGIHRQFVIFGRVWGDPIIDNDDIGIIGPDVGYTLLPPLGDTIPIPPDPNYELKYPSPIGSEDCIGIVI